MTSYNGRNFQIECIVNEFEIPVLNVRQSPYKNAVIVRNLNRNINRNELLNDLVAALHLNQQISNVFGLYFLNEDNSPADHLSVVFLLRSVKKFFRKLRDYYNAESDLLFVRVNGELKEVIDLKRTNLSLLYLNNDSRCKIKQIVFDNVRGLNLHTTWNLLEKVIAEKPEEVISIIITKKNIFLIFSTEFGTTELLRSLLLNFGTDYNLRELNEKLVFLRKNTIRPSNASFNFVNDINIVVNLRA